MPYTAIVPTDQECSHAALRTRKGTILRTGEPGSLVGTSRPTSRGDTMAPRRNPVRPSPVRAAWLVSVQSVVWTVVASGIAIALGIAGDSAVLIAFGAIGLVD